MNGSVIRFYMHEGQTHQGALLYKWLLERARNLGIPGGSAFKAIAGYGRHRVVHDNVFVEILGQLTVVVEFIVSDEDADRLFDMVRHERPPLFWARYPTEFGTLRGSNENAPTDDG